MIIDLTCKKHAGVDAIITNLMVPALNSYEVIPVEDDSGKVLTGFFNNIDNNTGEFSQTNVGSLIINNVDESASSAKNGDTILQAFENTRTCINDTINNVANNHIIGVSEIEITDGSTVKPIINGRVITPSLYDIVQYNNSIFIWAYDKWNVIGSGVEMSVSDHTLNITIE